MRGFAMRLFHMGRDVAVWGDMTTPALGAGDLFIASAGPGDLPTAQTLVEVARKGCARSTPIWSDPLACPDRAGRENRGASIATTIRRDCSHNSFLSRQGRSRP